MGFKFLETNISNEPDHITQERFNELVEHQLQTNIPHPNILSVDNRPAVFININRNLNTISEDEMNYLLQCQRRNLMDYMWENGLISHNIISQDDNGFTFRTEINF